MKTYLQIAALCVLSIIPFSSKAQKADGGLYLFGVATSFNDSTVYLTSIQMVPGATKNPKTGFLNNRLNYSNQLKEYLEMNYVGYETCAVFFADDKKDIEKKYVKLRRRYQKITDRYLLELPFDAFRFVAKPL